MKTSNKIHRLGIDIGKKQFHLWGVSKSERPILRKKLKRSQLLAYIANTEPCLIFMEACGGAHHWAREFIKLGHEVRLIAPQFVKPYVQGNKNDFNDAEGICEAGGRPKMRFVAVKTVDQQAMLSLHRIRQSIMKARTAQSNRMRGLLAEFGLVINQGWSALKKGIPEILEDESNGLPASFRANLAELMEEFRHLEDRLKYYDQQVKVQGELLKSPKRLVAVEGVGDIASTAVVATFGDARQFKNGRQFSAAVGLVPRHTGTGGEVHLQGISKRGDRYVRTLLIHGARAAVNSAISKSKPKTDRRSIWIQRLVKERGYNRATVALANKNARIIWALLSRGDTYDPNYA